MKKVLLGTSALIAAAAVSAPAMAQERIQLGIGGKMEQYFGVMSLDEATGEDRTSTGIDTDVEVYFTGATTLDNGLTVGAVIQLGAEANTAEGAGDADEQYAYIEGSFGRIMAGEKDGVHAQMAHIAPAVGLGIGDVDDWTGDFSLFARSQDGATGGYHNVDTTSSADIPSITYITPSLAGFSAGVTFQPNRDGARTGDENAETTNRWQAAVAYNGEFSGVGIGADIAYVHADLADGFGAANPTFEDNDTIWRGGLVLSYAGFQFGGSYLQRDYAANTTVLGVRDIEDTVWDLGVAYETGPYGVSLTYANVERELDNNAGNTQENEYQQVSLHGSYTMGPGINLVGAAFWADAEYDDNNAATADVDADGTGAIVGLALSF
jgi:outer membrane protein OmpU